MNAAVRQRALVVEDEVIIAMLIEEMLGELGYEVAATAGHLDEAVRIASSGRFDFAVLDLNLSGQMSFPGADVLRGRGLPFLFATGYGGKALPPTYAAAPVLQKPFSLDELRRSLALAGL